MYLYKHRNNTDIAFEVLKRFYIRENGAYSLKVAWWRVRGDEVLYPFNIVERIQLKRDVLTNDWEYIDFKSRKTHNG